MIKLRIRFLVIAGLMAFLTQSCSPDDTVVPLDDLTTAVGQQGQNGNQNGPNNGNNSNGPQNNSLVSRMDHEVATTWMQLFLELDRYATGMRPNATARAIAYIGLAAYETALPGMPDYVSNGQHINGLRVRPNRNLRNVNWALALNESYAKTFDHFINNVQDGRKQAIDELRAELEEKYSAGLNDRAIQDSKQWGQSAANQVIAFAQTDAQAEEQILDPQPTSYVPPTGEGFWTFSAEPERALFPYWGTVRTFAIAPNETTTIPPVAFSTNANSDFYAQMIEVYESNNTAKVEDNEDLWIAEFWSDDVENLVFSPPGRQVSIANQLIDQYTYDLEEALHLYVKLGLSLNDAAVSTWKYKYDYMVMRPNVFIHEFIDPTFQTNLYRLIPWPNPTFPGYPSGHSCFASAAAGVFINFFGETINFTDRSHEGRTEFRGTPRTFSSFRQMAEENGYSRIPLGVHIRMDCTEGLRLGYEISDAIIDYQLRRERS